jgi:hypothetical protein
MPIKHLAARLLLASLLGQALWAMPAGPSLPGPSPLAVFLTDESLYLCPLCGDRFLAVYEMIATQVGPGRVWVVIAGEKYGKRTEAQAFRSAVKKRIQAFLRSNGIICPVMDDSNGALRGPGGVLPACITFDTASGSVRSFALPQMEIRKKP